MLTADWVRFNAAAPRVKEPWSATATKARSRSGLHHGPSITDGDAVDHSYAFP